MATGSGKTMMAVASVYRLIKFGGARRVLFLVDRGNLAEQAEKEFLNFWTPDDHRKFSELYNVQRLTSSTIGASSKVVITTIQRLYSMLKGDQDFEEAQEEESLFEPPRPAHPRPADRRRPPISARADRGHHERPGRAGSDGLAGGEGMSPIPEATIHAGVVRAAFILCMELRNDLG